jgi:hypothetical protein
MSDIEGEINVILTALDLSDIDAEIPALGTSFILNWQSDQAANQNSGDTQPAC